MGYEIKGVYYIKLLSDYKCFKKGSELIVIDRGDYFSLPFTKIPKDNVKIKILKKL
ncbi:MAG: hypothetical protein QW474_01200 [Candidatus Aenigmatarchaeota archaeon]